MDYTNKKIHDAAVKLRKHIASLENPRDILKDDRLKGLYALIPTLESQDRAAFGQELNQLKTELLAIAEEQTQKSEALPALDVSAPMDRNAQPPLAFSHDSGSAHPLMTELDSVLDIFYRMGFQAIESRQLDDDYHMFETLNFPEGHPARDHYDTFMTEEGLMAPAHTSTMQHRVLAAQKAALEAGGTIRTVIPGRVFRNEDLDARHEHTFYQVEGICVGEGITTGNLIATLKTFLQEYYQTSLEVKTQPFYFPFTEPSFEFAISCPFCQKAGCKVCGEGWIELLGCGMIHPNVLHMAGIDSDRFTGFAWGFGVDRLVMIKHGIEDVRHFESGKLEFLRQFK